MGPTHSAPRNDEGQAPNGERTLGVVTVNFCHCDEDPKPAPKPPKVLVGEERFRPNESRAIQCALCNYDRMTGDQMLSLPWKHCHKCFVLWEEDPASRATGAEVQERERQDVEGGHDRGCYLDAHCSKCCPNCNDQN